MFRVFHILHIRPSLYELYRSAMHATVCPDGFAEPHDEPHVTIVVPTTTVRDPGVVPNTRPHPPPRPRPWPHRAHTPCTPDLLEARGKELQAQVFRYE